MEKLNIAEILKDCPKGMELDCTLFEDVHFDCIDDVCDIIKCYIQDSTHKTGVSFDRYGCYSSLSKAKCVIFPKGKTTWEGFQRPFKDGDVVVSKAGNIAIFSNLGEDDAVVYHCCYMGKKLGLLDKKGYGIGVFNDCRLATLEEKQKLFDAIKANGYKWNAETKTLEKLIEPKFKVGDRVISKMDQIVYTIKERDDVYFMQADVTGFCYHIPFDKERYYELVPNKFDITTLKPFESRVLVRDYNTHIWEPAFWGKLLDEKNPNLRYLTTNGCFKYCIPYENNQHLLGTTNDCDEYFKTWE